MSDAPRFVHRILSSGEHSITSPDVKGLSAVADTESDAREEAERLLAYFLRRGITIRARETREARGRVIYCIPFADFDEFVTGLGFILDDRSERTFAYVRGDEAIVVRRPNAHGDITEAAANDALDAADIVPPAFDMHWCD